MPNEFRSQSFEMKDCESRTNLFLGVYTPDGTHFEYGI